MHEKDYLYQVMDQTTVEVTRKMTGVKLFPTTQPFSCAPEKRYALKIDITGSVVGLDAVFFRAQPRAYLMLAEKMKGGPVSQLADVDVYMKEYFNVLCGRVISRINKETKSKMRFGVPSWHKSPCEADGPSLLEICYQCPDCGGLLSITGVGGQFNI